MSIYTKITTFISLMMISAHSFATFHDLNGGVSGQGGTTTNIPEPSTLAILSIGVVGLIVTRMMRK